MVSTATDLENNLVKFLSTFIFLIYNPFLNIL